MQQLSRKRQVMVKQVVPNRYERQEALKSLFAKHIGRDNPISQGQLFRQVFGDPNDFKKIEIFFLWTKLKQDMNWLRRTSKCFIVSRLQDNHWQFFVAKDEKDAQYYINMMHHTIKKCGSMIKRCEQAVEKKYYKDLQKEYGYS